MDTLPLKKNIAALRSRCTGVKVMTIAQVLNFEDEIVRCTDVDKALNLTKSKSVSEFKTAVHKMKEAEFRRALERHKFDLSKLWTQSVSECFEFIKQDGESVKTAD